MRGTPDHMATTLARTALLAVDARRWRHAAVTTTAARTRRAHSSDRRTRATEHRATDGTRDRGTGRGRSTDRDRHRPRPARQGTRHGARLRRLDHQGRRHHGARAAPPRVIGTQLAAGQQDVFWQYYNAENGGIAGKYPVEVVLEDNLYETTTTCRSTTRSRTTS